MIIVDVETTGVDPSKHSILSIGAIDFNNPSNRFSIECGAFEGAHVDDKALAITGHTKESVFDTAKPSEAEAIVKFIAWADGVDDRTVAGQNCSFDLAFLHAAAHRAGVDLSLAHRVVDLHSVVWTHMVNKGKTIPLDTKHRHSAINSDFITHYVGIPNETGPHIGINGALWETEAFSRLLYDKPLLPEYQSYKIPWL